MMQDLRVAQRKGVLSIAIYLVMGWLVVIAIRPLTHALPAAGLYWLVAGRLSYKTGVVFYRLDNKVPYALEIFHFLVLSGSGCHYLSILFYAA